MADDSILDDILYDTDSPTAFGNGELMAQAQRLARRKAMLEADALQSARQAGIYARPAGPIQVPGFTSAVTGTPVAGRAIKQPLLNSLAPLVADTARGWQEDAYDKDLSGYNRLQSAAARAHMASMPGDTMPTTEQAPGAYGVNSVPVPSTRPTTTQDRVAWATRGAEIPSLAPYMKEYAIDQMTKAPDRAATRQWEQFKFGVEQSGQSAQRGETARHNLATEAQAAATAAREANKPVYFADGAYRAFPDGRIEKTVIPTKEERESKQDATDNIATSVKAKNVATKAKALLESGTPTSSWVGSKVDQFISLFGGSLESADAAATLKQLAGQLVSTVPKFKGPDSDKDVATYRQMAGDIGNDQLPLPQRLAMLEAVMEMHETNTVVAAAKAGPGIRESIEAQVNGANPQKGSRSVSGTLTTAPGQTPVVVREGTEKSTGRRVQLMSDGSKRYVN